VIQDKKAMIVEIVAFSVLFFGKFIKFFCFIYKTIIIFALLSYNNHKIIIT